MARPKYHPRVEALLREIENPLPGVRFCTFQTEDFIINFYAIAGKQYANMELFQGEGEAVHITEAVEIPQGYEEVFKQNLLLQDYPLQDLDMSCVYFQERN